MTAIPADRFFLGGDLNPESHERTADLTVYNPDDLVTHGVIVGMTGSGKTGLGIVLLEEALLQGIPTLVIDPKGDLGNLALRFPQLRATDFLPWIDPGEATKKGQTPEQFAADTAASWQQGLAGWGIDGARIQAFSDRADVTIYTPGSSAGVPLNLVGSLQAPPAGTDPEAMHDEIEGFVTGLLAMAGISADPLTSPEHILLTNLIADQWSKGRSLDLAGLLTLVQDPPLRKLGVIDLDTFFPPKDRMGLLVRLNGLLASPSFRAWADGPPLDIARMLWTPEGKPRAAVVSLAHLGDEERQFVVTVLFSKVITWMRAQSGTASLRALLYMDEVFGYVPPNGMPPAKKPILTILKQARAFGVGLVLATQNPVDIDYKALSNAGTWMIGRLQTERDKARLLEGLTSASGAVDIAAVDRTISSLDKRQFVLQRSGSSGPKLFTTRWAMSYLRGPLTREQILTLTEHAPERSLGLTSSGSAAGSGASNGGGNGATAAEVSTAAGATELGDDETTVPPAVAEGVRVAWLDPAAAWAADVGAEPNGRVFAPALVAKVQLLFDDTKADLRVTEDWEAVLCPIDDGAGWEQAVVVDHEPRDFRPAAPAGAVFRLPAVALDRAAFFRDAQKRLVNYLKVSEQLELSTCKPLGVTQRPGESAEEFAARVQRAADDRAEDEAGKVRDRLTARIDKVRAAIEEAEARADDLREQQRAKRAGGVLKAAGGLLGSFLGGRRSSKQLARSLGTAAGSIVGGSGSSTLEAAERKAAAGRDSLEDLEADLAAELTEIHDRWDRTASEITTLTIPVDAGDVTVQELFLCWIPVA